MRPLSEQVVVVAGASSGIGRPTVTEFAAAWRRRWVRRRPNQGAPYAPEVVARTIVHAAQHPQREIPVGGSALSFILGQRFAPALMDKMMARRSFAVNGRQSGKASEMS